jgi:uncharacterized protein (TIGR02391 family)
MAKKSPERPLIDEKHFGSPEEIDFSIAKLDRRIEELRNLDVKATILNHTGAHGVVSSNVRSAIREIFGTNSPEFREHEHLTLWSGSLHVNMSNEQIIHGTEAGRNKAITILNGLIGRLREKREDLTQEQISVPSSYFERLKLHPRIADVAKDLFLDGYHWQAVFEAAKALVNYVKERSGRHELDGAPLMRTVFSKNDPILAFNDLADQTDLDEQEGMMHLFEGAVLGVRNPGGHSFPEGPEQRATEYISLLSLLAYRVQEAERRRKP